MSYRELALTALLVNSANDRHGELDSEAVAIAWLFTNQESAMRKLARDIAETGEVYEPPLVWPSDAQYIVFDGNRRVTCLKLILKPKLAPSRELQAFFHTLKASWKGNLPQRLVCQIETDRERIDEILLRRHTGTRGGVGRSPWTDRMTATFVERTGKGGGVNVADEIERRLEAAGMLPEKKMPWSTANRLLSSEGLRNRVGISVTQRRFQLTHPETLVLPVFRRLADDLANRSVVLADLWDNEGKVAYLDKLEAEGVLPLPVLSFQSSIESRDSGRSARNGVGFELSKEENIGSTSEPHPLPKPTPLPKPLKRMTLIPHNDQRVTWQVHTQRQRQIWQELQFKLKLEDHPNAISVMLRVLFELSIDNYINRTNLAGIHTNDSLKNKVMKVGVDLAIRQKIDQKYAGQIRKLENADKIFSIDTMNRYVHSSDFAPSPSHLTALWDQVSRLVVICLNA